jgi:hypothetical protein
MHLGAVEDTKIFPDFLVITIEADFYLPRPKPSLARQKMTL